MEDRFKYKVTEQKKNVKTFEVSIDKALEQEYYEKEFQKLAADVKIAGFRPGKAPRNVVEPKVAMDALNETINTLLPDVTVQVLVKENITPLGRIQYDIKDVKTENALVYAFTVYSYPEINVEKVKKIKVSAKKEETKDSEVDSVIRNIIRSTLPPEKWRKEDKKEESEKKEDEKNDEKVEEKKEITVDDSFQITDEMVKELGYEDAPTLEILRKQVKESLDKTKTNQYETELLEKGLVEVQKVVEMEVPHELIHQEADHRQADFEERLAKINLKVEDYLKTQGKTMEEIHSEWEADIEKMLFRDVFAVQLSHVEKIVPTEEELDLEIDKIEDELTRIKYKGNQNYRDQFRTMVSVNKGLERFLSWIR